MNPPLGFTADVRRRLNAALGYRMPCPTCRHQERPSLKALARVIGIGGATLGRFLDGGPVHTDSMDRIVAYVERKELGA